MITKKTIYIVFYIFCILIFLIILISLLGIKTFNNKVEKEKSILFYSNEKKLDKITEKDLDMLPELLKNYLLKINILGKPKYCNVTFEQTGKIRSNPKKDWLPFTAIQYMSSINHGFIWKSKALPILVRDKYLDEKGEVLISVLGIKKIHQHLGPEVDQSSLGRYFGELIWFPMGFLDPDITWSTVDQKTIKGIITKGNLSLEGYFFLMLME